MVSLGVSLSIGIGVVSRLGRAISTKYIVARTRFVLAPAPGLASASDSRLVLALA